MRDTSYQVIPSVFSTKSLGKEKEKIEPLPSFDSSSNPRQAFQQFL